MRAEIIAVGSELLTPDHLDTNSLFLTEELNRLGYRVSRKMVVGDEPGPLREVFRLALESADLAVTSGGLGPTADDLTRETLADLLGRRLVRNDALLQQIQERFRRFGRTMPEINARQAMVPEGALVLPNPRGTAPGLWLDVRDKVVILLPGPPGELKPLFVDEVRPRLERHGTGVRLFSRELRVVGLGESEVDQRIAPLYQRYDGLETTILSGNGEIRIHARLWSKDATAAERVLDDLVKHLALALGENLFTTAGESLEEIVAAELQAHRATIAVAESCTGGMLAMRLTNIPGSSSYFRGGAVCYSNDLKTAWADVPPEMIETKGAVSPEVALALADGIRRRTAAALGLGVTGIAGPGGGTAEKPIGLVHIGLVSEKESRERAFHFSGDRDRIRLYATQAALDMVRRYFIHPPHGK